MITHGFLQDLILGALTLAAICSVALTWLTMRRLKRIDAQIAHLGKGTVWLMMDLEWRLAWVEKHPGVPVAKPPHNDWDAERTRH